MPGVLAKVFHDAFGIERRLMTTVHAYTAERNLHDRPHRDLRRARAAALSFIPTTSGAAKTIGLILPKFSGKFDGFALRVPVPVGSITDLTAISSRAVTVLEVQAAYKKAAEGPRQGLMDYVEGEIVSSDIVGNPASSIFDACLVRVIGDQVKPSSWYDNKWGFSNRMVDLTNYVAARL